MNAVAFERRRARWAIGRSDCVAIDQVAAALSELERIVKHSVATGGLDLDGRRSGRCLLGNEPQTG